MTDLNEVLKRLEPEEIEGPEESVVDDLAQLRERWPHPIPEDHLAFLQNHGFYDGGLVRDGEVVVDQHRIFDVATILEELDWFEGDLEEDALLPVGGQDDWRDCLTPSGEYVDYEMGSGDVLEEYEVRTLGGLLDAVIDGADDDE